MPQQPIAFSTYPHSVPLFAGDVRLVNFYPEKAEGPARTQFVLIGTPHMKEFSDVTAVAATSGLECRGFHWFFAESNLYVVIGNLLFTVASDGTATQIPGNIAGTGPVTMVSDFDQMLIITAPGTGDYIWDGTTLSQLTGANIVDWRDAAILDGYAVQVQNTPDVAGRLSWTDVEALATVSAGSFANAESSPDGLLRIMKVGRLLCLLGEDTTELWYSTGDSTAPFARHANFTREIGIGAENSRTSLPASGGGGEDLGFFLGISKKSKPGVYMIRGGGLSRVSTNALDRILGKNTYSDARGFAYGIEGHSFYCLTLPTASRCFVYDADENEWHERQTGVSDVAGWDARQCIVAHDKVLVGHANDGKIYELDYDTYTDAGEKCLAMFTAQMQSSGEFENRLDRISVEMEVGVGTLGDEEAGNPQPQIMMRLSKNGGKTWGPERWRGFGYAGRYNRGPPTWCGCGKFRTCLAQFKITDAVARNITQVFASGVPGRRSV